MSLTRRALILRIAQLGGAGAAYEALTALDFIATPTAAATALELPTGAGRGRSVVILGAGLAGLTTAYELDRAGFDCTVLEASNRAGGRVFTLRRGDRFRETRGRAAQTCEFDDGLYFDAGASRIPHNHTRVLGYCRRFGLTLQPHVFASRANFIHSRHLAGGGTIRLRRALHDLQGHVAELLAKCTRTPGIDLPVTDEDVAALRDMLRRMGGLGTSRWGARDRYRYTNREGRAGFATPPGSAGDPGVPLTPMGLDEILRSNVWNGFLFADARAALQGTLLEPVGGMDRLIQAFLAQPARGGGRLADRIRLSAPVREITTSDGGVKIGYREAGARRTLRADYCVSTLPAPILKGLKTNLPAPFTDALDRLWVMPAGKIAWQAERFWETEDQIFGGVSWTTDTIHQIGYPSHGFLQPTGILTGAYVYGMKAWEFNALPVTDRLRTARLQGAKIHPGLDKRVSRGLAIGWENMEFSRVGWIDPSHPQFSRHAESLSRPQGRFHMAGDQLTQLSGWQEGAVLSAWSAVRAIAAPGHQLGTP